MEIVVKGTGSAFYTPDEVTINFDFITKSSSYESVLNMGTRNVYDFIQNLLLPMGFKKEDLKTRNFIIREDTKYNEQTRRHEFVGYAYSQNAQLKFDYNEELLAKIMDELAKLNNPPKSYVNFGVKDNKECRKDILAKAYNDALNQAEAIALAAGKTLKDCVKVDFQPMTAGYLSRSGFDGAVMCEKARLGMGTAEDITNIFTPEDVELSETLYCYWLAE